MSELALYNILNTAYRNIGVAINNAQKVALEYEVFMSDIEHSTGNGKVVDDIENYFSNLIKIHHAKDNNN